MSLIKRFKNSCASLAARWGSEYSYDVLPPESVRAASVLPHVLENLVAFSNNEYERNPYYKQVIDNLANHTVGPAPSIIATSKSVSDAENDLVEDQYADWTSSNGIGQAYRNIRREAAKTGLGIGIPYVNLTSTSAVPLSYKVYGMDSLKTPVGSIPSDRIYHGIQYTADWEVESFHIKTDTQAMSMEDTQEFKVNEVIYWGKNYWKGMFWPMPECVSAFSMYPYVRRFLQAVIEGEEFKASMPMAVELDPKVYSAYAQSVRDMNPSGAFEYQPKMVPTLAPGMSLKGLPNSVSSADREKIMQLFAASCALSVSMPKNIALGDSSNSNMASAQVDIQPWSNKVKIDRFDMEPMYRRSFNEWWRIAVRRVMTNNIRVAHLTTYPHLYVYPDLFEHPDPNKRASARALDLASGATTLNRLYSNMGLNFRRELVREAQCLNITPDELTSIIISTRSTSALSVLQTNQSLATGE
jgi:hypothetical protein